MDNLIENFLEKKVGLTFDSVEDAILFLTKYKIKTNKNFNMGYVAQQLFRITSLGNVIVYDSFGLAVTRHYIPNMLYKENLYEVELIWQV